MKLDAFHQVADRLASPVLLLTTASEVIAENPSARSALGDGVRGARLADKVEDGDGFCRYLVQASRSSSPLPGAIAIVERGQWRCDASRWTGELPCLLIQLRPAAISSVRFVALNAQIDRLNAEILRREALELERDELLERERRSRERAEEASQLKDEFLASVSHELRTPLNAISGWIDLIDGAGEPELISHGIEVIKRNIVAQTRLIEDLLDVSQAITGRLELELEPVDLADVIRDAINSCRPAAEAKGQSIELVANGQRSVLKGDPRRLLQIMWNLVANAIKYTPAGGTIEIAMRVINSHIEIAVSDTGQGIAPELLPFIFERFRRGEGRVIGDSGLGLGLAVVRHLVELHGGVIMANSAGRGQGATFTVNLPLPPFRSPRAVVEPLTEARDPERLDELRILLVEDHDDSRELVAALLEARGAQVVPCASADEAREAFAARRPDLIISDIEMPGEDGFTMIRKIRALEQSQGHARVPAIAVTAHSIGEARLQALRSGFQVFLLKPINTMELVETIAGLHEVEAR